MDAEDESLNLLEDSKIVVVDSPGDEFTWLPSLLFLAKSC